MYTTDDFHDIPIGTIIIGKDNRTKYLKPEQTERYHTNNMFVSLKTGKLVHFSNILVKAYKQREHTSIGTPGKQMDKYPTIDCFIPDAERMTDIDYPDPTTPNHAQLWTNRFLLIMNNMLVTRDLRVL